MRALDDPRLAGATMLACSVDTSLGEHELEARIYNSGFRWHVDISNRAAGSSHVRTFRIRFYQTFKRLLKRF
jgi:hypothetical protein